MKKKLNLVLRDPVKLHKSEQTVLDLPSPFIEKKNAETLELESENPALKTKTITTTEENNQNEKIEKAKQKPKEKIVDQVEKLDDVREKMSMRVRQVWEYFCDAANKDNELQNSFTVTRAEVMKSAGIGSTNTYRDALKKFQDLGLLKIELRPGVNAGSIFHLTENGIEQAKLCNEKVNG